MRAVAAPASHAGTSACGPCGFRVGLLLRGRRGPRLAHLWWGCLRLLPWLLPWLLYARLLRLLRRRRTQLLELRLRPLLGLVGLPLRACRAILRPSLVFNDARLLGGLRTRLLYLPLLLLHQLLGAPLFPLLRHTRARVRRARLTFSGSVSVDDDGRLIAFTPREQFLSSVRGPSRTVEHSSALRRSAFRRKAALR